MPLNTIQTYIKGELDQLTIPASLGPLDAYVTPPPVEPLDGPKCYVWGGVLKETRQTMPRGQGFKRLIWTVDIYLTYTTPSTAADPAALDQEFPLVIDAVMQKLRVVEMPTYANDPTTDQLSQILSVGEDMELEYPPERAIANMRNLLYGCRIGAKVEEAIQA